MDIKKHLKHLLVFFFGYSFFITGRILRQATVDWTDIVYSAGISLMIMIIVWYFQLKRERAPKKP